MVVVVREGERERGGGGGRQTDRQRDTLILYCFRQSP